MNEITISEFYDNEKHARGADMLKFYLMPFVMFVLFGFPTRFGSYIQTFSNFAAPAFYILCGFFVLCPDAQKRTKKIASALKKSFKFFIFLFATYVTINIFYFSFIGAFGIIKTFSKWIIFEFLVLNIWPVILPAGNSIWFIQSLFYAYVFFYLADRIKLLRFNLPLFVLFYLIMLFTGEFSALAGFPHLGYPFIPGGAVTRAIPYMLLGMLIRKNADRLLTLRPRVYVIFFVIGMALAVLEVFLLSYFHILTYYGHLIGLGVMALSVCCLALSAPQMKKTFITAHGRNYAKRIYVLCQPVSLAITLLVSSSATKYVQYIVAFKSIIVFFICLVIAFLIGIIKYYFIPK